MKARLCLDIPSLDVRGVDRRDPQTLRVARKLEDAEDAKHPQRDERAAERLVVGDAESDVVRQDGDDVDDAHGTRHVVAATWRSVETETTIGGHCHVAAITCPVPPASSTSSPLCTALRRE